MKAIKRHESWRFIAFMALYFSCIALSVPA
jgi:hypothetical protein